MRTRLSWNPGGAQLSDELAAQLDDPASHLARPHWEVKARAAPQILAEQPSVAVLQRFRDNLAVGNRLRPALRDELRRAVRALQVPRQLPKVTSETAPTPKALFLLEAPWATSLDESEHA